MSAPALTPAPPASVPPGIFVPSPFPAFAGIKVVMPEQYTSTPYVGDQSVLLQTMLDAVGAEQGVILLSGFLHFASPVNAKYPNIAIIALNGGAGVFYKGAGLVYTGAGAATAIDGTAQTAWFLSGFELTYTNAAFTGVLLDLSGVVAVADGSLHKFVNLLIRPGGLLDSHAAMIKGDRSHSWDILNCVGIASKVFYGKVTNATYANRWNIVGGYWQGRTNAPFWNIDQDAQFDSNTWEPKSDGSPGALDHDAGVTSRGITVKTPLIGDETVAGAWFKHGGDGLHIDGGLLSIDIAADSLVQITDDNAGPITIENAEVYRKATSTLVDINGHAGVLPVTIRKNKYHDAAPALATDLINGAIPYGSLIEISTSINDYVDPTHGLKIHWCDIVGRIMDDYRVIGDANARFQIGSNGTLRWGPGGGTAIGDCLLQRSAAGILNLLNGKLTATNGLGVGNSAAATVLGAVVKKMQIFDAAGASLGFIPIYDAIT